MGTERIIQPVFLITDEKYSRNLGNMTDARNKRANETCKLS